MRLIFLSLFYALIPCISTAQVANFSTSQSEGCGYLLVQFNASASSGTGSLTYHWDFGNGNKEDLDDKIAFASYDETGTYTVKLIVEDGNGNMSAPFTRTIQIHEAPVPNFSTSGTTSGCSPLNVQFHDGSSSGSTISKYFWEFGDGNTSNEQNPLHEYTSPGNFTVNLQVTDQNGCVANIEKKDVVSTTGGIRFNISGDRTYSCDTSSSLTTNFNPGLGYTVDLTQYNFLWDFGDGTTSTEPKPTHTFSKGAYDVDLTVSTKDGLCSVQQKYPSFINVGKVNASISYGNTYPHCGFPVFKFEIENFGVADDQDIRWDFGDGTTETRTGSRSIDHKFLSSGNYEVTAFIGDPFDPTCVSEAKTTAVINIPDYKFTADNPHNCNSVPITFTPPNIWNSQSFIWQFGDGTSSYEKEPVKTYTQNGTYDVTLTIVIGKENACLLTFEQKDFVHVGGPSATLNTNGREILYDMPVGYDLSGLSTEYLEGGCLSDAVNFSATDIKGDIEKYIWIFGDGTTQETTTPQTSHNYVMEGEFSPELVLVDKQGCTDTVRCDDCVRRGDKNIADVVITSNGDTVNYINDTICCFYNFGFYNQTDPDEVDLIWYYLDLVGDLPPAFSGYYKENGQFYDYSGAIANPASLDFMYILASFSLTVVGDDPNLFYDAYDNGCPTKVEYPKFVNHRLPWGNFLYTPPECEPNVDPNADTVVFDLNDPVTFQGDWLAEENYPLDSVVIGIPLPGYGSYTYRRSEHGILNLQQLQNKGAFPVIKFHKADNPGMFMVTTNLYDSDPADPNGFIKPPAAIDECGPPGPACFDQVPITVILDAITVNIITQSSVNSGCAPLTVDFQLQDRRVVQADSTLTWLFSDGQVAYGPNPTVTFPDPDTITYHMSGYDSSGCVIDSVFINDTIIVNGINVSFEIDSIALCLNDPALSQVNITNNSYSSGTIVENKWNFAGYEEMVRNDPQFDYHFPPGSAPPLHLQFVPKYIVLTATDDAGCTQKDSVAVYLRKPEAKVNFALKENNSCRPWAWMDLDHYEFVGGVPPIYGDLYWKWDTATDYNVKQLFGAHGTQVFSKGQAGAINMFVKINGDAMGECPATSKDTTFTFVVDTIKANFSISDTLVVCAPATVTFNDTNTVLIGDSVAIEERNWILYNSFGEIERTSTDAIPTFVLSTQGYYKLELKVTDENGCKGTVISDSVLLIDSPEADIMLPNDTICMGESLLYKVESLGGNGFSWDFGDGERPMNNDSVHYTFNQPGQKIVRVTVYYFYADTNNCQSDARDSIYVKPAPILNIKDTTVCKEDTAYLEAPFSPDYSYFWEPSGSINSSLPVTVADTFYLTVKEIREGCISYDTIVVSHYNLPVVTIDAESPVCEGQDVELISSSDPMATTYEWTRGNQLFSTVETPTITIDTTLTVYLHVVDINGCENDAEKKIIGVEKPILEIEDIILCIPDSILVNANPINGQYPSKKYVWIKDNQKLNDTTEQVLLKEAGEYMVEIDVGECQSSDTFKLTVNPKPDISKNDEVIIYCEEFGDAQLDAGEAIEYWWYHSGETSREVYVNVEDTFSVQLTNEFGCTAEDTILVISRCRPIVKVPDAFIPGDVNGLDNKFYVNYYNIGEFQLYIFNRWGEIIFETEDPDDAWDGKYNGKDMPPGVYPWLIRYKGDNPDYKKNNEIKGSVTIIR